MIESRIHLNLVHGDRKIYFHCPGCGIAHCVDPSIWDWNDDIYNPTISPSILVLGGDKGQVCHSFVRDGQIQFLTDSTHELSGRTVDIPSWR